MGLLDFLRGTRQSGLTRLPAGSLTVDASGKVVASTLPQSFPEGQALRIARIVLRAFERGRSAQLPLAELVIQYNALKITARELRGGAVIFLRPQPLDQSM